VLAIGSALDRAIKEFRPEIVHCWSDLANVIGGLVSTDLGVPRVVLGQRNLPVFRSIDAYRLLIRNLNVVVLNNSLAGLVGYARWLDVPKLEDQASLQWFLSQGIHIRHQGESKTCRRHLGIPSDTQVVGAVMRFALPSATGDVLGAIEAVHCTAHDARSGLILQRGRCDRTNRWAFLASAAREDRQCPSPIALIPIARKESLPLRQYRQHRLWPFWAPAVLGASH
jgi:hypothetical protein